MKRKNIFIAHTKEHKWEYLFGGVLLSISSLLQLFLPMLLGTITDKLQALSITKGRMLVLAGWLALVAFGIGFFVSTSRVYIFRLSRILETRLRGDLFKHWEQLSANYYNNQRVGDLMSHAVSDVNVMRGTSMQAFFNLLQAIILIVITVITMVTTINPMLTLLTMLPLPMLSYLAYRFSHQIQSQSKAVQEAISGMTSRVQEFVAGIRVVKAFVQEKEEIALFEKDNRHAVNMNLRFVKSNALFQSMSAAIIGLSFIVSVILGGILVIQGKITLGSFVAFNSYLSLLTGPIQNLGNVINQIQRGLASEERLLDIFNTEPDVADEVSARSDIVELRGNIQINHLTFSYPEVDDAQLKDIQLHIPEGSSLAIVGKVGSGKTTLIHLLVRLYNPPKGTIFIDGFDVHEIPLHTLRGQIGIVPQDAFLFSSSIKDNISFDPKAYTDTEIEDAARIAQVYDNILEFPHQFETRLGERGITLSGGQRQRVSIARAVIKEPSILIFDDSLSAVDTVTEDRILQGLEQVMERRTTIIVSHRVSSVQKADQIAFMENGRIVELGTHEQLIQHGGLYADMVNKQQLDAAEELAEQMDDDSGWRRERVLE